MTDPEDVGRARGWMRDPDACKHDCGSNWTPGKKGSFGRCMYCGLQLKAPGRVGWGVGFQYALQPPEAQAGAPRTRGSDS